MKRNKFCSFIGAITVIGTITTFSCSPSEDKPIEPPSTCPTCSVVIINTDETVSVTGKNDIDVLRSFFNSGTHPNDNKTNNPGQPLWSVELAYANAIGVNGTRSINGERGSNLDTNGDFIASGTLMTHLNAIHYHQWHPHLVVGQSQPEALTGEAWNWDSDQWNEYEDYAYKCLKYVMVDYNGGFPAAIIEVENEVNNPGQDGRWFVEGTWSNGDMKAYEGYIKLYAEWSDAVKRFKKDYPEKEIKLFGPACGKYPLIYSPEKSPNWPLMFIDDAKKNNWLIDGISFHWYTAEQLGSRPNYWPEERPSFRSKIHEIRNKLDSYGFSNVEIWITEWGPYSWFEREQIKNNYSPVGGAFVAAFMLESVDNEIDGMVPLHLRDPDKAAYWWSGIGSLATVDNVIYPKPFYNVFRMFYQLPGERKRVEWEEFNAQLGAVASASQDQIGIIVYNYDYDEYNEIDMTETHEIQVQIDTKEFSGALTVERYLVDEEHSNIAKFIDTGVIPPPVSECELQKVEEYITETVRNTITLKTVTLEKSAVTLWIINKN